MPQAKLVDVPKIYFSNKHCRRKRKKLSEVGILLDTKLKPVLIVTDYLLHRRLHNVVRPKSLKLDGRILRMFWEYLGVCRTFRPHHVKIAAL